jgi:hypothetical protein
MTDTSSTAEQDEYLAELRQEVVKAENELYEAVAEACPGRHGVVQHRDRQPPWCPYCGRMANGVRAR